MIKSGERIAPIEHEVSDTLFLSEQVRDSMLGWLGAVWGLAGMTLLLGQALYRLTPMALEALGISLSWFQWLVLMVWVGFMGISEGYRGFQKMFSPRFAARAHWLRHHPRLDAVLLAPFFCMGLFGATRKRLIVSWCLTLGIVLLILGVRQLSQPWRGIIDAGVVFGLTWGLATVIWFTARTFYSQEPATDPEIAPQWLVKTGDDAPCIQNPVL